MKFSTKALKTQDLKQNQSIRDVTFKNIQYPINPVDMVSLINPLGQTIFRGKVNDNFLDVSHLLPGVYILSVENIGINYVQKIIKL